MRKDFKRELRQRREIELSEKGERMLGETEADIEAGLVREYDNIQDLINDLNNAAARD